MNFLRYCEWWATARREEGDQVCGLPGERRREIGEFTINVGAQENFGSPPHPPLQKLAIFWSDLTVQVW